MTDAQVVDRHVRATRIFFVKWISSSGEAGLKRIGMVPDLVRMRRQLKDSGCREITVETHLVPRDKDAMIAWLDANDFMPSQPVIVETVRLA